MVKGITLLSIEEAEVLDKSILACDNQWWLRSPGFISKYISAVYSDGSDTKYGINVDDEHGVRPALIIPNLKSLNLPQYSIVKCFDTDWYVISDNMILSKDIIAKHRFDEKFNEYEKSEIKDFIEAWLQIELSGKGIIHDKHTI